MADTTVELPPDTRRVRREDLREDLCDAPPHDRDDDPDLRARLDAHIAGILALDMALPCRSPDQATAPAPAPAELEYTFRLFRHDPPAAARVIIESASAPRRPGGFVVPRRPLSHYLAPAATGALKAQFDFAAVTIEELLERSRERWPGREMPWRVVGASMIVAKRKAERETLEDGRAGGVDAAAAAAAAVVLVAGAEGDAAGNRRRTRPGKTRRIVMRGRLRSQLAAEKAAAESQKAKLEKEEKASEKRKRMNRQKKLRMRAKKKAARSEGRSGDNGSESSDGSGGPTDSE